MLGKRHAEQSRNAIRTTYVINRLQDHVSGKLELSQSQVRAAEILLRHSLPALQAVNNSVSGEVTLKWMS